MEGLHRRDSVGGARAAGAREQREADVMGDLLSVERDEAALVWQAKAQGLPVEHRADCSPLAILQCRLVTAPPVNAPTGSSPEHAWSIIGGRGR
jgi:hypothetical protein